MNNEYQKDRWYKLWQDLTPETEIQMWDFYGGRNWILKYTPRFGKVIEAGCGLGRYNFYLTRFGIDIEGLDYDEKLILYINDWKNKNNFDCNFIVGDILNLPYEDNSISGVISLGVIEHFIEGPHKALSEIYRILRPGGIAIISTPSIHFGLYSKYLKNIIRNFLIENFNINLKNEEFFQYWYTPRKLKSFLESTKFKVTIYKGIDLLYPFYDLGGRTSNNIYKNSLAEWAFNNFENSTISNIGAQSFTIAIKNDNNMFCFFCGIKKAFKDSILNYTVPVCNECKKEKLSLYYLKNKYPKIRYKVLIKPNIEPPKIKKCEFCFNSYLTDKIFENYGFAKSVCPNCLRNIKINILLSNEYIQPIWRKRRKKVLI